MKHKHVTDRIEPSNDYNTRLTENAPEASPAGKLDAAIPVDPKTNTIISEKDGINYFTGCKTQHPETVLDVIDSTAGREAAIHVVYTDTYEDAVGLFAALLDSGCLLETFVDIYYKENSGFVAFEPADSLSATQPERAVKQFIDRHTERPDEHDESDSETKTEPDTERSTDIEKDKLYAYLRHWIGNTTRMEPPSRTTASQLLSGVNGLEKVTQNSMEGAHHYWRLDGRVWNFH